MASHRCGRQSTKHKAALKGRPGANTGVATMPAVLRDAGISDWTPHAVRSAFATVLIDATEDAAASAILAHKRPEIAAASGKAGRRGSGRRDDALLRPIPTATLETGRNGNIGRSARGARRDLPGNKAAPWEWPRLPKRRIANSSSVFSGNVPPSPETFRVATLQGAPAKQARIGDRDPHRRQH